MEKETITICTRKKYKVEIVSNMINPEDLEQLINENYNNYYNLSFVEPWGVDYMFLLFVDSIEPGFKRIHIGGG